MGAICCKSESIDFTQESKYFNINFKNKNNV